MIPGGLEEVQRAINDIRYAEWKTRFRKKWKRLFGGDWDKDGSKRRGMND